MVCVVFGMWIECWWCGLYVGGWWNVGVGWCVDWGYGVCVGVLLLVVLFV